jgi:hypothetical protein
MEKAYKILSSPDLHPIEVKKFNEDSDVLREVHGIYASQRDGEIAYNRVVHGSGSHSWDCILVEDGVMKWSVV